MPYDRSCSTCSTTPRSTAHRVRRSPSTWLSSVRTCGWPSRIRDQSVSAISRARPPPDSGGRPMITTTTDHVDHREPTATIATMPRILIVEDNPDLAYGLRTGLEIEGYEAEVAHDGERGLDRA